MTRSSTADLYRLLALAGELPDTLQRRCLAVGLANGDIDLLSALATLERLNPDVSARLAAHGSARVRAAWMGAERRDAATVAGLLQQEKRVSVLTVAAGRRDLSVELQRLIAGRANPTVAGELLRNRYVERSVREQVLSSSIEHGDSDEVCWTLLDALRIDPFLASFAASRIHSPMALTVLLGESLDDAGRGVPGLEGRRRATLPSASNAS